MIHPISFLVVSGFLGLVLLLPADSFGQCQKGQKGGGGGGGPRGGFPRQQTPFNPMTQFPQTPMNPLLQQRQMQTPLPFMLQQRYQQQLLQQLTQQQVLQQQLMMQQQTLQAQQMSQYLQGQTDATLQQAVNNSNLYLRALAGQEFNRRALAQPSSDQNP